MSESPIINKPSDILEWLMEIPDEEAKSRAIANHRAAVTDESGWTEDVKHQGIPEALSDAFHWASSPEGWAYWNTYFVTLVEEEEALRHRQLP